VSRNISQLSETKISVDFKGFPISAQGKSIAQFLDSKPNIFKSDFLFPILVIKESALKNNLETMARFCSNQKVKLSPHVKTSMSPQLATLQSKYGAVSLTIANLQQLLVFKDFGFNTFFIANEVANDAALIQIGKFNSSLEAKISFCVDSVNSAKRIAQLCQNNSDLKFEIYLEIGSNNARGGIRNLDDVATILTILKVPQVVIGGISGFEGALPNAARSKRGLKSVSKFAKKMLAALEIAEQQVGNKLKLTAGGSAFFDVVATELSQNGKNEVILRSGGYLTHDHVHYEDIYPFRNSKDFKFLPALELWSEVLSQPEKGFALLNFGKRDVGNDLDNPVPLWHIPNSNRTKGISAASEISAVITQLNDQHGFMKYRKVNNSNISTSSTSSSIEYSDLIGLGVSHPCTNFDKWKILFVVNDDYDVIDCIHTFF